MKELKSMKVPADTLPSLKLISALTGEKQYAVLERLVSAELERLQARDTVAAISESTKP